MTFEELQKAGARSMTFDELKKAGATPEEPAKPEGPGAGESFLRSASNAVTSHLANPIAAGITHLVNGQPYQEALRGINDSDAEAQAAHPTASTAGTVAGTVGQLAAPIGRLAEGASLGARALHAGAVGAGYGALGGAGEALEQGGGIGEAGLGAAKGAALGGATGAALGYGVGKLFRGAPERVDERLVRDITRGEAGGKAAKKLGDKVAALAEDDAVPQAIGDDVATAPTQHRWVGPKADAELQSRADQPLRSRPMPEPSSEPTVPNAVPRTMPAEVPVRSSMSPVASAPAVGSGSNRVTQALDGEGLTRAVALNAAHNPGEAAKAIQGALDRTQAKVLDPIYKAVDAGPANPQAISVKLDLQAAADRARAEGASQTASHIDRFLTSIDKNYEDGKTLTASMLRKLRNEVGVGNAFPTADEAAAAPGVQAKQAIYRTLNGAIEKAADATPGVDSATLRAGNQRAATLIPLAQSLADRAAKAKTGASTATHAIAGGLALGEIAHIAAEGMSTGNVLGAAGKIAAIYAARKVPGALAKAGRAVDYSAAEIERAARAGGANAKLVRAIGEQVAKRGGAVAARAKLAQDGGDSD
jgi:hypothetical protein